MKLNLKYFSYLSLLIVLLLGACKEEPKTPAPANKSMTLQQAPVERADGNVTYRGFGSVLNIYTSNYDEAKKLLFDRFSKENGVEVKVLEMEADALLNRMQSEGTACPADLLILDDMNRLWRSNHMGLLRSLSDMTIASRIPATYRDYANHWTVLTKRAVVVAYAKDRVKAGDLTTYKELADPKWKGRLLVPASSDTHVQSLLSAVISWEGEEGARAWAAGIVANMARPPKGGDKDQLMGLDAEQGDIALVTTRGYGRLQYSKVASEKKASEAIALIYPTSPEGKTHFNISGIAAGESSPNIGNAVRMMHFLTEEANQGVLAGANFEYPVLPNLEAASFVQDMGTFAEDKLPLENLGVNNQVALKIFKEVGWN